MSTTPHEEVVEPAANADQEETRFVFSQEDMETEHVQLKRRQAVQVRKETMAAKELTELIKKQMERGPHNLSMPEKNLYKAKWEKTMDDLKEINKKKNDLVDEIFYYCTRQ